MATDFPIVQKTYDFIKWYVPILNRLPRDHKFMLGKRLCSNLYDILNGFIKVRLLKEKQDQLSALRMV
jgi:hypothetical protein